MATDGAAPVRAFWVALERGDRAAALAVLAPDVRWDGAGAGAADAPSACHDRTHVAAFLEHAHAHGRRARLLRLQDAGEHVVAVVATATADHRATHGEVVTVRDGRIVAMVVHPTARAAQRAAGVREDRRLRVPLAGRLGDPSGRSGRVVAAVLNVANRRLNRVAVEALRLEAGERLLDVGFGGAVGTRLALAQGAAVVAIDPSADAVAAARRRLTGRVEVRQGTAAAPGAETMDAALAVNSIYFWPTVEHGLAGVRGALRHGGRLAVAVEHGPLRRHARHHVDLPATPAALAERLTASGFEAVRTHRAGRGRTVLLAIRPPGAATVGAT